MYMTNEEWEQNNQDYLKESYEETGFTAGGYFTMSTPKTAAGKRAIPILPEVRKALEQERTNQQELELVCEYEIDGISDFVFLNCFGQPQNPQTVMRFSRCGAGFGNKKSPHNNLNLTIPSGMALVRVCYVAIRKLKTCSGSFGSRAGTLSKYVILNCWNRLPQKLSRVNVNLSGRGPSILLRKTVLSLKSPTGAFIAPLRSANANF